MGLALRESLGGEGSRALTDYMEAYGDDWKADVRDDCTRRLDVRLATLVTREEFARGLADVRLELSALRQDVTRELSSQRVEWLRWSFLFWIGQVAATAALIGLALRFAE
jgi:hypothetical protein